MWPMSSGEAKATRRHGSADGRAHMPGPSTPGDNRAMKSLPLIIVLSSLSIFGSSSKMYEMSDKISRGKTQRRDEISAGELNAINMRRPISVIWLTNIKLACRRGGELQY